MNQFSVAAIQDKLTENPLVEQRLKPQRVGAPPQSSVEGAADQVNLAFVHFLSCARN